MEFVYTNGKNKDFIRLCLLLDEYLNEAVGGEAGLCPQGVQGPKNIHTAYGKAGGKSKGPGL